MKTIELKVYKIDEISNKAKNKAYQNWCYNVEFCWHKEYQETLKEFCQIFNVETKNESLRYFTPKKCEYKYQDIVENFSGHRLAKYLYNNYFTIISSKKSYYGKAISQKSKLRKSKITYSDLNLTGFCADYNILKPIEEFLKKPNSTTFRELLADCIQEFFKGYNHDIEYCSSFEYFLEESENNENFYLESGENYYGK